MQIRKIGVIALGVMLSFTILSAELSAQQQQQGQGPGPETRLAILVQAENQFPGANNAVDEVLEALTDHFEDSNRFGVLPEGRVENALEELEIEIDQDSSGRQVNQFADEVNADFVLIFTIDPLGDRQVQLEAKAFNSRGQEVFSEDTDRISLNNEGQLVRAAENLLEEILDEIN